jgi:hypothetical protein
MRGVLGPFQFATVRENIVKNSKKSNVWQNVSVEWTAESSLHIMYV